MRFGFGSHGPGEFLRFASDTSPKCIDHEGHGRRSAGTRVRVRKFKYNSRNKEPIPQNKQKRFSFQIESRTLDVVVSVSLHLYNVSKLILDNLGARLYRN